MASIKLSRRQLLQSSLFASGAMANLSSASLFSCDALTAKKRVAAVVTIYRYNSHADVILGKILEGWKQDGGAGPQLELVSLYVDQFPADDMSRKLAERFGFRLCSTIEETLTLGGNQLAVDGVISIGEHGDYPWNAKEQHLYPRRRFFAAIADTFEKCGSVVPVFNDKHPGPEWGDAVWMYQRAKELQIPWMAGSSLPVSYRQPDQTLRWQDEVSACVAIGYSGLDIYGFHTLDFMQCLLERRKGGELGVEWVQSLPTSKIGEWLDQGLMDSKLLDEALAVTGGDRVKLLQSPPTDGALFVIQYRDGLKVPVLMLPGNAQGIGTAIRTKSSDVIATRTEERPDPRHPHFAYLLKGIEKMFHTGKPSYPVERSLLTAGILDRLLTSRHQQNVRLETPELAIEYKPVDYGYAPHLEL
jgi:hypothetical protein